MKVLGIRRKVKGRGQEEEEAERRGGRERGTQGASWEENEKERSEEERQI